jgi:uncharacterized protein with FMN-binding domain
LSACSLADPDDRQSSATTANSRDKPANTSARYRDGVYEARGWYGNLPSHVDVTITLTQERVTHVKVTPRATDPTSLEYQRWFAEAVPRAVTGRPLDQIHVGRLAGASGTPDGFNDALSKIKREARQ